jgi:hypothetical protein
MITKTRLKQVFKMVEEENPGTKFIRHAVVPEHNIVVSMYQMKKKPHMIRVMAWAYNPVDNEFEYIGTTMQMFSKDQTKIAKWYQDYVQESYSGGIKVSDPGIKVLKNKGYHDED